MKGQAEAIDGDAQVVTDPADDPVVPGDPMTFQEWGDRVQKAFQFAGVTPIPDPDDAWSDMHAEGVSPQDAFARLTAN